MNSDVQEIWPAGHRCALAIAAVVLDPQSGVPGADYAATGLTKLTGLLEDFDLTITTCWDHGATQTLPTLVKMTTDLGHEIADYTAGQLTGNSWIAPGASGDLPAVSDDQVVIPVSPWWTDTAWLNPVHPQPPSSMLETLSTGLQSVRSEGTLMTVVVHPHLIMRPGFGAMFTRFLDEAIGSGDTWLTRFDHLALWWQERTRQEQQ